MKVLKSGLLLSVLFVFVFCSDKSTDWQENITIEFGTACGWCAGYETLTISDLTVNFQRIIPCGENQGTFQNSKPISQDEWNEITASFNYSYFQSLDFDECNVCVDGCDEHIQITENHKSHTITYSPSTEIAGLENLRENIVMNFSFEKGDKSISYGKRKG